MDDEIRMFAEGRPSAGPYSGEAREKARAELLREARGRGRFRFPRVGLQAAAAFAVTIALVGGVAAVMTRQDQGVAVAPDPAPGQYVMVETQVTEGRVVVGDGGATRQMNRITKQVWHAAGGEPVLMKLTTQPVGPWPGEKELPQSVTQSRRIEWARLAGCVPVVTLPADAEGMRQLIYTPDERADQNPDTAAFERARGLLIERYLPKEQQEALAAAIRGIPGIQMAEGVQDEAARSGNALGLVFAGQLHQIIFDAQSGEYLGLRNTAVNEKEAQAPVGSVLSSAAQVSVQVVDEVPGLDASARMVDPCPSATPKSTPTPTPTLSDEATFTSTITPTPNDEPTAVESFELRATLQPTPMTPGS